MVVFYLFGACRVFCLPDDQHMIPSILYSLSSTIIFGIFDVSDVSNMVVLDIDIGNVVFSTHLVRVGI